MPHYCLGENCKIVIIDRKQRCPPCIKLQRRLYDQRRHRTMLDNNHTKKQKTNILVDQSPSLLDTYNEGYAKLKQNLANAVQLPTLEYIKTTSELMREYATHATNGFNNGKRKFINIYQDIMYKEVGFESLHKKTIAKFVASRIGKADSIAELCCLPLKTILMTPRLGHGLDQHDLSRLLVYKLALYIQNKSTLPPELVDEINKPFFPMYKTFTRSQETVLLQLSAKGLGDDIKIIDDIPGLSSSVHNGSDKLDILVQSKDMLFFRTLPLHKSMVNSKTAAITEACHELAEFEMQEELYMRANDLPFGRDVDASQKRLVQQEYIHRQQELQKKQVMLEHVFKKIAHDA